MRTAVVVVLLCVVAAVLADQAELGKKAETEKRARRFQNTDWVNYNTNPAVFGQRQPLPYNYPIRCWSASVALAVLEEVDNFSKKYFFTLPDSAWSIVNVSDGNGGYAPTLTISNAYSLSSRSNNVQLVGCVPCGYGANGQDPLCVYA